MGCTESKHEHGPKLHQTEKKDQEFLVGNALFQLECFAL
jgi:hypothetical protein